MVCRLKLVRAGALALCAAAASIVAAARSDDVYVCIILPAGASTEPRTSVAPVAVDAPPIELSSRLASRLSPGTAGTFKLRVSADGTVKSVIFPPDEKATDLVQPIRSALTRWKFALGEMERSQSVDIPLTFRVERLPPIREGSGRAPQPPFPVYRVEPSPIPALTRRDHRSVLPFYGPVPPQTVILQNAKGGVRQISVQTGAPRLDFFPSDSSPFVAWFPGTVSLTYEVDASGTTRGISIRDSNCPILEPEAIAAVRAWRFSPARSGGEAVRCELNDTLAFRTTHERRMPAFIRRPSADEGTPGVWDNAPAFVSLSLPIYPQALAASHVEGTARIQVGLDATGSVLSATVAHTDHDAFGYALRAAMLASRFAPATRANQPVASVFELEASFNHAPEDLLPDDTRLPAISLTYAGEPPVPAGRLDVQPRLVSGSQPKFQTAEGAAAAAGDAVIDCIVDATGRVKEPAITSCSHPDVGYAAVQACASWMFDPPLAHGRPVAARVRLPFSVRPKAPDSEVVAGPRKAEKCPQE